MSIGEKLTAIAENEEKVYAAGEQAARSHCRSEHYVTTVVGDGSTALTFDLPFEPDLLCLSGFHPSSYTAAGAVVMLVADLSGLAHRWCMGSARLANGGLDSYVLKPSSVHKKCFFTENGGYTVRDLPTSDGKGAFFVAGLPYVVTAVKYTDKTVAERITEFVRSLTGSGTATLDATKVEAAFSEADWQALIDQRPDWTFTLS